MKFRRTPLLVLLFLSLACWSCGGNEASTPNGASDASQSQTPLASQQEAKLRINVDKLRVRKGPGKAAEVISELAENTVVTDLKEASKELAEATLRGVKHKAPWIKIRTADGIEGWIFGGAATPMKSGDEGPAESSKVAFTKTLSKLDHRQCADLEKAKSALQDYLRGQPADADASVKAFHDFFLRRIDDANNNEVDFKREGEYLLADYNPEKLPVPDDIQQQFAQWKSCGIKADFPEGMINLVEQPDYMMKHFGNLVSPSMKSYLTQQQKELAEGFAVDAGLTITPQAVAERLAFWDEFLKKNPRFVYHEDIRGFNKFMLGTLMSGLDNTPAFDWEDNKLNADWKAAYEWLMTKHQSTPSGQSIKEYYMLLKKHDFKRTKEVSAYNDKFWES